MSCYIETIQDICQENFALEVKADTSIKSLNLDGVDYAILIAAVEERFSISIDDDEALKLDIVKDMEGVINACLGS